MLRVSGASPNDQKRSLKGEVVGKLEGTSSDRNERSKGEHMSYAIIGFGKIGHALAKAFAARASKYPFQPRATRKALHPMRPRSEPRSFPKH
jgi:lactate dehydrogenase-like 2-hydroxyacid dehydrogenase